MLAPPFLFFFFFIKKTKVVLFKEILFEKRDGKERKRYIFKRKNGVL